MRGPFNNFLKYGTEGRTSIDMALTDYTDFLSETVGDQVVGDFDDLLTTSTYLGNDLENKEISLITVLHSLDMMKNSVMAVHLQVIKEITSK